MKDIEVGDIVHVRGEVVEASHTEPPRVKVCNVLIYVPTCYVVHVEPRPIKVGDRVKIVDGGNKATVVATDEQEVWVKWDGRKSHCTYHQGQLTRIDGEPS